VYLCSLRYDHAFGPSARQTDVYKQVEDCSARVLQGTLGSHTHNLCMACIIHNAHRMQQGGLQGRALFIVLMGDYI
jgi:hypothetical protein